MYKLLSVLSLVFATSAMASDLPDHARTPGATDPDITQANIQNTVCVKGYTKTVRPPANYTNKLKKKQIHEYGYDDTNPKHYEEDHLIPLSIGGNPRSPKNLWPEPRKSEWNAAKKDQLEYVIYKMVCNNDIMLKDAQDQISSDWIAAYKKYVHGKGGRHKFKFKHVD